MTAPLRASDPVQVCDSVQVKVALGDRTNMAFQNTQVTRGTASLVVTATGQSTQMGLIADMVTVLRNSARKNIANRNDEYSVW